MIFRLEEDDDDQVKCNAHPVGTMRLKLFLWHGTFRSSCEDVLVMKGIVFIGYICAFYATPSI